MSPLNVRCLLHYYYSAEGTVFENDCGSIGSFESEGAIAQNDNGDFVITDLGRAWVISILNVKKPTLAFLDENGREIPL